MATYALLKQSQGWQVLTTAKPAGGQTEGQPAQATKATFGLPPLWGFWSCSHPSCAGTFTSLLTVMSTYMNASNIIRKSHFLICFSLPYSLPSCAPAWNPRQHDMHISWAKLDPGSE